MNSENQFRGCGPKWKQRHRCDLKVSFDWMRYKGEKTISTHTWSSEGRRFETVQPGTRSAGNAMATQPTGPGVPGPRPICWERRSHAMRRRTYGLGSACGNAVLNTAQIPYLNDYASNRIALKHLFAFFLLSQGYEHHYCKISGPTCQVLVFIYLFNKKKQLMICLYFWIAVVVRWRNRGHRFIF